MNQSTAKLTIREIKGSLGRYMAIFAIIALGSGLFVGLRLSRPDFIETYDRYTHEVNFYDFRLISTLGLTKKDVKQVQKLDFVTDAEGVVTSDFMFKNAEGENLIMVAQTIPERINLIDLKAGRMPEKANECLADPEMYSEDDIGKTIKLSPDNTEQTMDSFACDEYTIVGLTETVLYINLERGSTTLGNGSVEGYVYLLPEGFSTDYFTDIYVTVDADGYVYSDEYKDNIEQYVKPLEELMEKRAVIRYNDIIDTAQEELSKAKAQYEDGASQYESAKAEYERGAEEFKTQKAQTEKKLKDAKAELDRSEKMLKDPSVLDEKQAELNAGKAELDKAKAEYESGLRQFETKSKAAYLTVNSSIKSNTSKIERKETKIAELEAELEELYAQRDEALANGKKVKLTLREKIKQKENSLEDNIAELEKAQVKLNDSLAEKAEIDAELAPYRAELDDAKAQIDAGYAEIADGQAQLDDARQMMKDGARRLAEGKAQYEQAKKQAEEGFAAAEKELKSGKEQLKEAKIELDSAKIQLNDAEKQIKNMEHADTYVLGRDTNIGYVCFESDTNVVQSVAGVFPVFFFLVAALVCLTTMTRMIDDQRTQIGIMKALGYSSYSIMLKYMIYSGSATLLGSVFGIAAGAFAFPAIVWFGYSIIYSFSSLTFTMNWGLSALITFANLAVTMLVTWYCCRKELKCQPSELIRPKAPEAGKRILLEKVPLIWNKLSFMQKVSVRNIMRYKKRIFMMLLGIGGCTALVLTAIGLDDTIKGVVGEQYDEIIHYDYELSLAYDMNSEEQKIFLDGCGDNVDKALFMYRGTADVSDGEFTKSVTLTATDESNISDFVDLHYEGESVEYPKTNEAVINYNLARLMDIGVGDELTVTTADMETLKVTVSALFDNYVENLMYVSLDTCREQWGYAPELKSALLTAPEGKDINDCATAIAKVDGVRMMQLSVDSRDRIEHMMDSLLFVVTMIILCAGILAFIVLYNLTNINISERIREIATIKVLGFYPNEAASCVFRENLVLTGAGALFGLLLGIALHAFVMNAIKVDMMYFRPIINFDSYLISIVLTFVFAIIVNRIMRRRIDNIDMAGALKSIE